MIVVFEVRIGKIINFKEININSDDIQNIKVEGNIRIKGVERSLKTSGKIKVVDGVIQAKATFNIKPQDFEIKIPNTVFDKIAKVVIIQVDLSLKHIK